MRFDDLRIVACDAPRCASFRSRSNASSSSFRAPVGSVSATIGGHQAPGPRPPRSGRGLECGPEGSIEPLEDPPRAGQVGPRHPLADPKHVVVTGPSQKFGTTWGTSCSASAGSIAASRTAASPRWRWIVAGVDRAGILRVFPFEDRPGGAEIDHGQHLGEVLGGEGELVPRQRRDDRPPLAQDRRGPVDEPQLEPSVGDSARAGASRASLSSTRRGLGQGAVDQLDPARALCLAQSVGEREEALGAGGRVPVGLDRRDRRIRVVLELRQARPGRAQSPPAGSTRFSSISRTRSGSTRARAGTTD